MTQSIAIYGEKSANSHLNNKFLKIYLTPGNVCVGPQCDRSVEKNPK